ncbi:hypothetical protein KJ953_03250 [Patescibacteria group bacterium]|nr:hypothetical protein [Patescibacteria group bacterium]MBU1256452.1 hypothetical protein [Patescibacteria group bacterium]MBU1457397.1 hypothetical protein [Patescibacteria group bacterium]
MARTRRTKKQKRRVQNRRGQGEIVGFKVNIDKLGLGKKDSGQAKMTKKIYKSYLRTDLTKTIILTMLAVALELALWHYLFR